MRGNFSPPVLFNQISYPSPNSITHKKEKPPKIPSSLFRAHCKPRMADSSNRELCENLD